MANPGDDTSSGFNADILIDSPKSRHFQIAKLLEYYFSQHVRVDVAEVGAGYGHLGKLLGRTSKLNYIGYEPSEQRAKFCQMHGVNVVCGMFPGSEAGLRFDAIVLDNVLEHVTNPLGLIHTISTSLKDNGIAIVIVPNRYDLRRFLPKWRKRHYWQPSCHINYFSYSDMVRMFSKVGLHVRDFDRQSLPEGCSLGLKAKTLLDSLCLHAGGLYLYALKQG